MRKQSRSEPKRIDTAASVPVAQGVTAPPLLTEAQAARWLGTSIWYLREDRIGKRRIPFVKLSRKVVRYRVADIQKALDRMVMGATT